MTHLLLAAAVTLAAVQQLPPLQVTGEVVDPSGSALPGAVVSVRGTPAIVVTDDRGRFTVAATMPATLVVEMPAFTTRTVQVAAASASIRIVLALQAHSEAVAVRAPVIDSPPDARVILRPIDVVRTAGARADLMRALAVSPGVVQLDEGAGLFVRGGDVSETTVLLDGVVVSHPYRYETPTGGFRGAIDPFLTQGITFSTGAFAADVGNSLSGLVDLRGQARPTIPRVSVTAGLAGVSAMAAVPVGGKAGIRVAGNRTTPSLLFAVNPSPREFDWLPGGWDVAGSAHLDTATRGRARVFLLEQRDHVGVELEKDAFVGFLHSNAEHRLVAASWLRTVGRDWNLSASAGTDAYANTTDVGVLAVTSSDRTGSARLDAGGRLGDWRLRLGTDAGTIRADVTGHAPERGGDFGGVSGVTSFRSAHRDWRTGAYGEITRRWGAVEPTVGLRADYFDHPGVFRADPRVNVTIDWGARGRVRAAWGLYDQAPSPRYFDQAHGAIRLAPMAATHYLAGYEAGRFDGAAYLRLETYAKTYRHLPVQDPVVGFRDDGYGSARGVDLFARRVWHYIDLRGSASWSHARRRWTSPEQRDRYPLPDGTWAPDFAVPFTWQFLATVPVSRTASVNLGWRTAAGRPFTPALGGVATDSGYEPVWGTINSERLPRYERLDLAASVTRTIGARAAAIFFVAVDNALARRNFFEYAYSADYSARHPVSSASPRSFYVGCSVTR